MLTALTILQSHFTSETAFQPAELDSLDAWMKSTYTRIIRITYNILKHHPSAEEDLKPETERQIEEVLRLINICQDYVWEELNIGHWKDVKLVWRELYSFVSLFKVAVLAVESKTSVPELIKICDNGLLMGCPILDNILATIARQLHTLLAKPLSQKEDTYQSEAVSEILHRLSGTIALPGRRIQVPLEDLPSIEMFSKKYFEPQIPVLLSGTLHHWPALSKWNPEYLVKIGGSRTVPVEIGSKYTAEDWTQKLITIEEFVEIYMKGNNRDQQMGYVAQHQLFEQIPEVMDDIRVPDYCCLGTKKDVEINAWFGPAGTLTPTHYDPNHNLLAQVFGTKFVRLFPPSEAVNLYPNAPDSLLFNTSQVDLEDALALEKWPNLQTITYADVILSPGSVLYIPPKWWHMVKSLSPSFSCSFWFE